MRLGAPAPCAVRLALCGRQVFTVHALIVADGVFAMALAAWWQLRRSANLLPHLRRGPSSFHFSPANAVVAWIMAAVTVPTRLTLHFRRSVPRPAALESGQRARIARVPVGTHTPARPGAVPESDTAPIPIPGPLRQAALQPTDSVPGPRPQPVVDPPTSPFPAVGPPTGPPHTGSGHGATEQPTDPPTRPALRPAVARRGSA